MPITVHHAVLSPVVAGEALGTETRHSTGVRTERDPMHNDPNAADLLVLDDAREILGRYAFGTWTHVSYTPAPDQPEQGDGADGCCATEEPVNLCDEGPVNGVGVDDNAETFVASRINARSRQFIARGYSAPELVRAYARGHQDGVDRAYRLQFTPEIRRTYGIPEADALAMGEHRFQLLVQDLSPRHLRGV